MCNVLIFPFHSYYSWSNFIIILYLRSNIGPRIIQGMEEERLTVHQYSLCYTGQIKTKEIKDTLGQCYNTKN